MSLASVAGWARQGMPGEQGRWPLPEIVRWLRTQGPWRPKAKPEDADPLLAEDGDSPGLERYRQAKAALAELDLEERKRSIVPLDKAKPILQRWASILRNVGERLGKRFGNDAAVAMNDALAECERILDRELSSDEPADDRAA